MRVLQLLPTIQAEGAQRMVAGLSRELRAAGHAVGVVSLFDPRGVSLEGELRDAGVELTCLGKRMGLDARMFARVPAAAARFAPDVVHTHIYVLKYLLPGLLLHRRCAIVHTVHNLAEREGGTAADVLVQRAAFRAGVAAVSIGAAVSASVLRLYGRPPHREIPNGIRTADYAPPPGAREAVRAELGLPAAAPVFVMVGRLAAAKNHALGVTAFAASALLATGAHLVVAGDGPLRDPLARQVQSLGLGGRVHLLGARPDVARVLAAADAFVLPSDYEGHPLAVLEAMAAGKPVVATAVGCVPETVTPATGRLVPAGDAAALSAAMLELARDPGFARVLGESGQRVARERYDVSAMAAAYERLYRELLAARRPRAVPQAEMAR